MMTPMMRSKTRTMMRLMAKCIGEKARLEGDGQGPMGPIPFHMPSYSFLTSFQSSSSSSSPPSSSSPAPSFSSSSSSSSSWGSSVFFGSFREDLPSVKPKSFPAFLCPSWPSYLACLRIRSSRRWWWGRAASRPGQRTLRTAKGSCCCSPRCAWSKIEKPNSNRVILRQESPEDISIGRCVGGLLQVKGLSCKGVGEPHVVRDQEVVEVDVVRHRPQLEAHSAENGAMKSDLLRCLVTWWESSWMVLCPRRNQGWGSLLVSTCLDSRGWRSWGRTTCPEKDFVKSKERLYQKS